MFPRETRPKMFHGGDISAQRGQLCSRGCSAPTTVRPFLPVSEILFPSRELLLNVGNCSKPALLRDWAKDRISYVQLNGGTKVAPYGCGEQCGFTKTLSTATFRHRCINSIAATRRVNSLSPEAETIQDCSDCLGANESFVSSYARRKSRSPGVSVFQGLISPITAMVRVRLFHCVGRLRSQCGRGLADSQELVCLQ